MTPALFFFVLSIGLFVWVLFLKLYLRLEKDRIEVLIPEMEKLEIEVAKLRHKNHKKKELLEIQDGIIKELENNR